MYLISIEKMTKRTTSIGIVITIILIIVFIYCTYEAFLNNDLFIGILFITFVISSLMTFAKCIIDYKYVRGILSYKQFKNHSRYEYWYFTYGNKAYEFYKKNYGVLDNKKR